MSEDNLEIWNKLCRPPADALKKIAGGRLKGMTDISPQWRYKIMTDVFGVCGVGWYFDIEATWVEECSEGQKVQGAEISLYIKDEKGEWSRRIAGVGGSKLIDKENRGLHTNDEAVKMAVTDALGTAMKLLGVAADIYMGLWDGSKYKESKDDSGKKDFTHPTTKTGTGDRKVQPLNTNFLDEMQSIKLILNKKTGDDKLYYMTLEDSGYKKSNQVEKPKHKACLKKFNDLVKEVMSL